LVAQLRGDAVGAFLASVQADEDARARASGAGAGAGAGGGGSNPEEKKDGDDTRMDEE
jgi:hypothetical protein